jgi:hypothetical protein
VLIDPQGLLHGDRVASCSDEAQLHFPRLLAASNTFGRFRMSVDWLQSEVYGSFHVKPQKEQMAAWLREYHANFLLFVYKAHDGSMWAQWDVPEKLLGRYRLATDRKTPAPAADELAAFKAAYVESLRARHHGDSDVISEGFGKVPQACESLRKVSQTCEDVQNVSQASEHVRTLPHDVGVVVGVLTGVAVGVVKDNCSEPSGSEPPIAQLPTNRSGEYYLVKFGAVEVWKRLYPSVNVEQELRNIEGWLLANPQKRKTDRGMPHFITTWLSKEQNAGGSSAAKGNHATSGQRGTGANPASGRNQRSATGIASAFSGFRTIPSGSADDAGEVQLSSAGDSTRDSRDVGSGVDCIGGEVRLAGDARSVGRPHDGVTILPTARGVARTHGSGAAYAVSGIRADDATAGNTAYGP